MSTPSTTPGPAKPTYAPYRLAHEPDGRSWTARENLTDLLKREVLGPADGPDETIPVAPDTRYLVGRIAPTRLVAQKDDQPSGEEDISELLDDPNGRGVPAVGEDQDTAADGEDDVDDQPQKRGLMIPASMGLRFQVPSELDEFTVTASWGVYKAFTPEQETPANGRKRPEFKRTPVQRTRQIETSTLDSGQTLPIHLLDDVWLRIDSRVDGERRLVELALCNDRETPRQIPVDAWMFQTELRIDAGGEEVFLPVRDPLTEDLYEPDMELRRLTLQYRDRLEFAVGRTCSADWEVAKGARRASQVSTTWLPITETPQTNAAEIGDATLDMLALAEAGSAALRTGLQPVVDAYTEWLNGQETGIAELPAHLQTVAKDALHDARRVRDQLAEGLDVLLKDADAQRCFAFMNKVMADQRIQTQVAELRAREPKLSRGDARARVLEQGTKAHSWRTFQLAFVLMQLPALVDPTIARRSGDLAKVELLFFTTGGGKTEAYLGLAAFAFAIRRRQGVIEGSDGKVDGRSGVTVLMRYTLRLLTSQQFQRATALVCAAELARREDEETWGTEPFRIGLWVGTDVSPKRFEEVDEQLKKVNEGRSHRLTVRQIQRCPWCGTPIEAANVHARKADRRVFVYCEDKLAQCPFAEGGSAGEGLPILTVDEEIYRLAPAFVIATVDKFARLAREGEAASLFGYVRKRCDRHGYVHDDYLPCSIKDGSKHPKNGGLPPAAVRPVTRLRPPDLIIQDELHLITGALGTTVGLFELAIDALTTWQHGDQRVQPLIVASTATVRNASDQVRSIYGRGTTVFPPRVLDVGNTFFSKEIEVTEQNPGRRYVGVSTTGVRMTAAEIRIAEVLMAGGQLLLDRSGQAADPYLSLVGYFSAIRELAGMTRYLTDDIATALKRGKPWAGLPRRYGTGFGELNIAELTSRVSSSGITATLDAMAAAFDPSVDSSEGRQAQLEASAAGKRSTKREQQPFDTILATAMLQVGVDVTRLGLMLMVGQPKNTAEYIQASSRVGRDEKRPGLVVTLGNWARPRDLAHFEQFRHYHETFYSQVEALTVTPYSVTARERGLDAVLVSVARVLGATSAEGLSPEKAAGKIQQESGLVESMIAALARRAGEASDEDSADAVRLRLLNRLDHWKQRTTKATQEHKSLVFERVKDASQLALMMSAEDAKSRSAAEAGAPFIIANSMREVQPEINVLVSPASDRLFLSEPPGSPQYRWPEEAT